MIILIVMARYNSCKQINYIINKIGDINLYGSFSAYKVKNIQTYNNYNQNCNGLHSCGNRSI